MYRNLAALEQAGVVRRVLTDEGFGRYELTEDLTGHHHHLVCSNCGAVEDVDFAPGFEETLEAAARGARRSHRLLGRLAPARSDRAVPQLRGRRERVSYGVR